MNELTYHLLDVFTNEKFGGNQLAVFQETNQLETDLMQKIARELNLSEAVFLFPPSDQTKTKQVRIFTPKMELPVAGHPTVGTAFLLGKENWLETAEGVNEWILEEGVGDILVRVYKEDGKITKAEMNQPLPSFGDIFSGISSAADLLSLSVDDIHTSVPIQTVSSGVPFLYIPVKSLDAMKRINFRNDVWQKTFSYHTETQHIFAFTTETVHASSTVHGRMFAPALGITEDPATGIASGPLGSYLIEHSLIPIQEDGQYIIRSEQGLEMGRPSFIDIFIYKEGKEYKQVKIGGMSVKVGEGKIFI
ncbi:PhzF family phenazine biosynthesis protein [Shimazuella alba]|uniref:PhzF family phenazine biosynthesis isomerase n=1 Tax=Shimazuella alba TaxID=2690964 RepID=A0A6I4VV46_9BACL|nr:PhzF family phenazine biosynthesis protein [Shimazuella alba]MXQ54055.1 PhzF family phenazine biosynthesis isomerase [Shimazuella alba]